MLKQFEPFRPQLLENWYLDFPPAQVTVHNVRTGQQIEEPSWVAAACKQVALPERNLYTGEILTVPRTAVEKLAAVGRAALEYKATPDTLVFSPFCGGRIVHYLTAQLFIRALFKQAGFPLLKPPVCVHIPDQTTQVEAQALSEAVIQAGARKVFLYTDPLSALLNNVHKWKELQTAVILHIEPQDE